MILRTVLALSLLLSLSAAASSKTSRPQLNPLKKALTVLSYNIKGLPSIALGDYDENRYGEIGKILAERSKSGKSPDIVVLQESFSERTRELREAAKYPHVAEGPRANSLLGVGSGLFILSRYPIEKQAERAFGEKLCASWDCYSNKGVQYAKIQVPGLPLPIEVYNTHLQASRSSDRIRRQQVKVLVEFFQETHEPGLPVIFAGDFNFRPGMGDESYKDFVKLTAFGNVGRFCLDQGCAAEADHGWHGIWSGAVDHHFFSKDSFVEILPTKVQRNFKELVGERRLSDHFGYEADYELKWDASLADKVKLVERVPATVTPGQ